AGAWRKGGQRRNMVVSYWRNPHPGGLFTYQLYFPMLGPPDAIASTAIYARPRLIIYGPSISSGGRGVERAKFSRNTLHSAGADANLRGNFEDALPGPQLTLDSFFQCWADLWPPELFALLYGPLEARMDSLADHAALK